MLNAKPLLPVSVRHAQKRSRRKGSCMRLVIMVAILSCVGYAVFATRYIGTSKNRREVQDNLIKAQVQRKSSVSANGAQHDGRSLKSDVYTPHISVREHASTHRTDAAIRKHEELSRDAFGDDGSYDGVIARDRGRLSEPQLSDTHSQDQGKIISPGIHHVAHESGRDDLQVHAPHVAPVDHHINQQNRHYEHQQAYQSPQIQQQQMQHQYQQQYQGSGSPVLAGPVEADRDAELRRQATVVSPSLAVGSRIEVDSHSGDAATRAAIEPGASPHPVQGDREPTSERPTQLAAPITVTHLEPDNHQTHQVPVHEPVISPAPHEADSSSHTVQHRAPEDVTRAPDIIVSSPVVTEPVPTPTVPVPVPEPVTAPVRAPHTDTAPPRNPLAKGFYALEAVDIDGKVRPLSEFAGKVTIVVNVASACGYTNENYKGLMKVYEKYKPHGLEILGFPCNQFGNQESGTEADIKSFCSAHFHVNFPMFSKVDVNGPNTHPVYQYLKRELPEWEGGGGGKGPGSDLVWNFQKIFVDHEGRPVKRLYQAWDQNAVESEAYRLLREARQAGVATHS
ncbi:hypothetical protein Vretimale_573 [Volvox reticuliferus]|uniref:Glutathione peroxidase n=1 Tax=Volvox reticuliferus TaxID=1737510 RepID=A0A8J4FDN9_9CHLO|nr:hypothetical protein Vretifemale_2419 [Volvox reticuliferus]GIL94345.1 hypothetical protein Vretimale_573 [Volvox reticuliferus]